MERLFVKYICKNSKDRNCDFYFNTLLTFPASGIMPKRHKKIADYLLDRKKSDKKLEKIYNKLKHPYKIKRFEETMPKLEKAREVAENIGLKNITAFCCLDRGYYCPKCNKFQMQVEFFMTWRDQLGNTQIYSFEHKCEQCDSNLIKLSGSMKQTTTLKCPKCGGDIEIDNNSIMNVPTI